MSQRIFQVCTEVYKDLRIEGESDFESKISELDERSEVIDIISKSADLEITDESVAREFCREKVRIELFNLIY